MHCKAILNASNLTYELANIRALFKDIAVAIHEGQRIGLVGCNGSGKSTLLKLLAQELTPKTGTIMRTGSIYYLPQVSTLNLSASNDSVQDLLSSISDEWWTVTNLLKEKFETELCLSASIGSLSGGELTKLWLAIAFSKQPDILLLDEPTNHLDLIALEQLRQVLQVFPGAIATRFPQAFFSRSSRRYDLGVNKKSALSVWWKLFFLPIAKRKRVSDCVTRSRSSTKKT